MLALSSSIKRSADRGSRFFTFGFPRLQRDGGNLPKFHFFILLLLCLIAIPALAAPQFPDRGTRPVVDDAHILSAQTIQQLSQKLEDYENGTGNQVVVVTLSSLQGYEIADYGYQLGRAWQLGKKDKNNGALLIVAPNERKTRIEVGYGLEGQLTDATSALIIQNVMLPNFRAGNFEQGVVDGTQAILDVLGGKGIRRSGAAGEPFSLWQAIFLIVFFLLFISFATRHPFLAMMMLSNSSFGRSYGGGDSGGFSGFSGGGGSFGGGGANGSW